MQTLPHPPQAEHELVAAAFVDHGILEEVGDLVGAGDFHNAILRTVWKSITAVVATDGVLDLPMLIEYLREHRLWDQVGGHDTISRLMDRRGSTAHVALYAREVREYARRRAVIGAAESIVVDGFGEMEDVQAYCLASEDKIRDAAAGKGGDAFVTPAEVVATVTARAMRTEAEGDTTRGVPCGLPRLDDEFLLGGLPRKLVVIAARPKMGKTNLGLQFALTMARAGRPGVIFSMEMTRDEIMERMLASMAKISSKKIAGSGALTGYDLDKFLDAGEKLARLPFLIDDSNRLTATQIRSRVGRATRTLGPLDWCLIDYFNIMSHPALKSGRADESMGVSSGILTDMAKDRGLVCILLAQLSRRCEEKADKRPEMHHIRECGALEQDAALVLSPFWPYKYRNVAGMYKTSSRDRAEMMILANRYGGEGIFPMKFWPAQHRYEELDDSLYGDA